MSAFNQEQVIDVQHWTDALFSFKTTRDPGFRFQNGQFVMMGLEVNGRPLLRAVSTMSFSSSSEKVGIGWPCGPQR